MQDNLGTVEVSRICQGEKYHRVPTEYVSLLDLWREQGIPWQEVNERILRLDREREPVFDSPSEDMRFCFVHGGFLSSDVFTPEEHALVYSKKPAPFFENGGMNPSYSTEMDKWQSMVDAVVDARVEPATKALEQACIERGGRLYRTAAKGAKYVVLKGSTYCRWSDVESFRAQGYKVVRWATAMRYFKLEAYWDCDNEDRNYRSTRQAESLASFLQEEEPPRMGETSPMVAQMTVQRPSVARGQEKKRGLLSRIFKK